MKKNPTNSDFIQKNTNERPCICAVNQYNPEVKVLTIILTGNREVLTTQSLVLFLGDELKSSFDVN